MKNILISTAMLLSFAVGPVAAQVQQGLHIKLIAPCFTSMEPVEQYLAERTNQRILFTASAYATVATSPNADETVPGLLVVYVDPDTTEFTAVMLYENGYTCLITNGVDFLPYVESRDTP